MLLVILAENRSVNIMFSSNLLTFGKILSQIKVRKLQIMVNMYISIPKIYPACQTDDNGIKPGSNLAIADTCVAKHSKAEYFGIKICM